MSGTVSCMTKKKRIIIILAILFTIVLIGIIVYGLMNRDSDEKTYSQLTGEEVSKEDSERPILGIMIENSQAARPQTGIDSAGIVIESVTEGGITRYLALYQEDTPQEVGPVRSLRPHFLDWAMGFDASIAHVGGSPEALDLVEERDAKSLNQFTYSEPYYRDDQRQAPHNMYVRVNDLQNLQEELGHITSSFKEISRKSDQPAESANATDISINFSSQLYQVAFLYNSADNTYTRSLAGEPHIDAATNEPIAVKNVIVLQSSSRGAPDAIGNGRGWIFMDGIVKDIEWEMNDFSSRIMFNDSEGNEVSLNRGDSWIAVLPEDRSVDY